MRIVNKALIGSALIVGSFIAFLAVDAIFGDGYYTNITPYEYL